MTTFVLVPGMWLGAWAWREVTARLRAAGHDVYPLTLTGLAERRHLGGPRTDLSTHVRDITALVEAEELTDVVLVGHSYAGAPVTMAADRIPELVRAVVYVDSGPVPDGTAPIEQQDPARQEATRTGARDGWRVPPREWAADTDPVLLAGLTPEALDRLRRGATDHPLGSLTEPAALTGRWADLPRTLVSCTFPVEQVREMVAERHPFMAGLYDADVVGVPTGHWPMLSEPGPLAEALAHV